MNFLLDSRSLWSTEYRVVKVTERGERISRSLRRFSLRCLTAFRNDTNCEIAGTTVYAWFACIFTTFCFEYRLLPALFYSLRRLERHARPNVQSRFALKAGEDFSHHRYVPLTPLAHVASGSYQKLYDKNITMYGQSRVLSHDNIVCR